MSPLASPSPKASPAKVTAGASTTPPMAQAPAPAQPAPPKKKRVHWKPDLAEIKYYELEEEERSSKRKHFRDLASGEHERERVALQELRKQHEIKPTLEWHRPVPLNREALQAVSAGLVLERGAESTERDEQLQRCRVTLASVYSGENQVPSSPAEPDEEPAAPTQPCATIPLSNEEALAMEAMRAEEQQQQPQQQQQQPQQQMLSSITDLDVDDSIVDEATLQSLAAALTSQQQPPAAPFDPSSVWGESQASPTRRGAPEYAHVEYAGYDRYRQNIGAAQPPMHREERPPPYEHHLPHPHHPRPHPHASPPPPPPPRGPAPAAVAAHAHAHQHPPAGFGYGRGDRRDFHRRSPPAARRRRDWKPRHEIPCKFFAQGRCARGDSCEFLHERR
ncbi:hypothetical protein PTSG_01981 [Salpingoeca rosetta]|uniref:C3H1-type domain-containing protein n=1 Tax=Salpingoeca rosetta (strain ATCC 50818 / BSB-021) TaxID=946362 RepID=F2TZI8_SALR5|nr:uncharacterized protein PTSG_01981 [Salpingoeca rosetta]EGD79012.1 hypothetical protein PTSG_01981 [Salpingoeca rosetta]|eukprot:XP_004997968.1 hypothetical protein PTSG_01981 [Salpingoeca rosetta]